jgi:hypothetical protein
MVLVSVVAEKKNHIRPTKTNFHATDAQVVKNSKAAYNILGFIF